MKTVVALTQNKIVPMKLTYKDVVTCKSYLGHISKMFDLADALGYEYFLWNGRVYKIAKAGEIRKYTIDTGLTFRDIE